MPRKKGDIETALERKGFRRHEGDHSWFVYYNQEGKKTLARTKTSHSTRSQVIGDPLLGQMAKQCFLSKSQFLQLIDCPLDRSGYEDLLHEQGKA